MNRYLRFVGAFGLATVLVPLTLSAQTKARPLPRTPDGHPDLQGVWDFRSATALERPERFAGREFMTPEEVVSYEQEALEREDGRPPDDGRTELSVHAVWWLDYGKKVVGSRRTSLIVDPPDGRPPPGTSLSLYKGIISFRPGSSRFFAGSVVFPRVASAPTAAAHDRP